MTIHADKDLAVRLETIEALNQVAYAIALNNAHKDAQASYKRIGTGYAVFAGIDSPLTQAFALGLDGVVSEQELLELEEFFKQRESAVNVEVCNLSDISLARLLVDRGYQITEYSNVLIKPLNDEPYFEPYDESFVRQIKEDDLEQFAQTISKGFLENDEPPASFLDMFNVWFNQSNCACFAAYINGEQAGGGAVFVNGGVGELGGASTLPRFRNRGVQTALLRARINYAKANGCDLAMVTTMPGTISQRNVEKQGFHIAYSRTKFTKQW